MEEEIMVAVRRDVSTREELRDRPEWGLTRQFRIAMRRIASSVTVVTTNDDAGRFHGMAASAVISVSMEPPSMLVAVNKAASIHPVLIECNKFCVNVLCDAHGDLIHAFSSTELREERFAFGDWTEGPGGLPYLASAVSSLFCDVDKSIDYGTHTLFLGRVTSVSDGSDARPLIWLSGAALQIHAPTPSQSSAKAKVRRKTRDRK
jgi:flavin reductase (DIM6/NTAB) family NADH-FMN oxidoreductase RutF